MRYLSRLAICLLLFASDNMLAADRPNIVILYADDMGYGDLTANNPESKIPTPNLDRLAAQGMRFTDAHSSSGICTPSRYAMLTGRFHWRKFHNIVDSFGSPVLDAAELTLAEMLKKKGYRTACLGKWHLGWNWKDIQRPDVDSKSHVDPKSGKRIYSPDAFDWSKKISGGPLSHGFDYYFGDDVPNFPPYAWFENDRVITDPSVPLTITPKTQEGNWEARPGPMTADWDFYNVGPQITEKTIQWIKDQRGSEQPFFMYSPFNSPHAPIVPTEEFVGQSQAGGFGDFVMQTDAYVGRILLALEECGFADNTLVIFTADNGAEHYAYERVRKFNHRSSGPLRGVKRDLYEGGHRVPFLVKWPGKIESGSVSSALISQVDLMATIAAIVDYPLTSGIAEDSYDMSRVWMAGAAGPRRSIVHNTMAGAYAVRHEDWVLIAHKTGSHTKVPAWFDQENNYSQSEDPGELYNLREDLAQRHNLYAQENSKVQELTSLLESIRSKGQVR